MAAYYDLAAPEYRYSEKKVEIVKSAGEAEGYFSSKRKIYQAEDNETIFIIVRHGENESNVQGTYDGRTLNLPLTDKGHKQGQKVGQILKDRVKKIDKVIINKMIRTRETADEILSSFPGSGPEFLSDDRLLERNLGRYEGKTLKEIEMTNKLDKATSAREDLSFEEKMRFSPEAGEIESYSAIWERAHQCIMELGSSNRGKTLLAVSHSGTIRSIYWHLCYDLGFFVPYSLFKPNNGAFLVVSVKEGHISLLETDDITISGH